MKVMKCGSRVITVIGQVKGLITGICIRENAVSYEMSYFNNGLSVVCWLREFEFTMDNDNSKKPGLVSYEPKNLEGETILIS